MMMGRKIFFFLFAYIPDSFVLCFILVCLHFAIFCVIIIIFRQPWFDFDFGLILFEFSDVMTQYISRSWGIKYIVCVCIRLKKSIFIFILISILQKYRKTLLQTICFIQNIKQRSASIKAQIKTKMVRCLYLFVLFFVWRNGP